MGVDLFDDIFVLDDKLERDDIACSVNTLVSARATNEL